MIKEIIIHHTGVSRKIQPYQAWTVNNYHKEKFNMLSSLGFYGGYTYLIEPTGYLVQYRRDTEEGAHTKGHNFHSIGICLTGNFCVEMPTDAQVNTLRKLLLDKLAQYNLTALNIFNHKDFGDTVCPGDFIIQGWGRCLVDPLPLPAYDEQKMDGLLEQKLTLIQKILELLKQLRDLV